MTREINIVTPEHVELSFELAGLGSRFIAILIDELLIALAIAVLVITLLLFHIDLASVQGLSSMSPWIIAVVVLLIFLLLSGYFLFFEATRNGQTPGKKAAGIRVVRDSGHPVDFRSALLRNLMRAVDSLPPGTYAIGFMSIFLSPQYRRLGDYVAGTLVVKMHPKPAKDQIGGIAETVTQTTNQPSSDPETEPAASSKFLLPQETLSLLTAVTREDYRAIRHFLDRRRELQENLALSLATKMAGPLAQKLQMDPASIENPLKFLEAVGIEWERRMIH